MEMKQFSNDEPNSTAPSKRRQRRPQKYSSSRKKEPFLSKLLYFIASVCLVGGVMVCNDYWTTAGGPVGTAQQSFAISALFSGVVSFGLLAAAGSALSYLKEISLNSTQ